MARADFSEKMLAVIAHWNIPKGSLTIELREAVLIGSFALVRNSMKELADKGVSFSIDKVPIKLYFFYTQVAKVT